MLAKMGVGSAPAMPYPAPKPPGEPSVGCIRRGKLLPEETDRACG